MRENRQAIEKSKEPLHSWIAAEHARLHVVAAWPESVLKKTLLTSIHSSIRRLTMDGEFVSYRCLGCTPEERR